MSDSAIPWTVAHQALLSMEFSRQEDWSGLPFPSPGDPPNPGIEPGSPTLRADSLLSELPGKPSFFYIKLKVSKKSKMFSLGKTGKRMKRQELPWWSGG